MQIIFDPNTIHQSKLGSVTGVVYFDFGLDQQFPIAGWNDFVVVLASWWLDALDDIADGRAETTLRFMDGPYWITIVPQGSALLLLKCVEDRRNSGLAYETSVKLADLEVELIKFARSVVQACSRKLIESADLDDLKRRLLR
jgi:hypothetical protein